MCKKDVGARIARPSFSPIFRFFKKSRISHRMQGMLGCEELRTLSQARNLVRRRREIRRRHDRASARQADTSGVMRQQHLLSLISGGSRYRQDTRLSAFFYKVGVVRFRFVFSYA